MTSARQRQANAANARASTGPRTAGGRARSARNAYRDGFSTPARLDLMFGAEIEALAGKIAGPAALPAVQKLACEIAEAQIALVRVRDLRQRILACSASDVVDPIAGILSDQAVTLQSLDRYERRALSRRKFKIRALDQIRMEESLA